MGRHIGLVIGLILLCIVFGETKVYAVDPYGTDPLIGTAEPYIEAAIAEGMKLVGKSKYLYGGGRGGVGNYSGGDRMDCSSFMHYIWNKGAGLLIVNNSTKDAGGVSTASMLSGMDVMRNVKVDDLKRGDMVFFNNPHVGIYLGNGIMLNDSSSNGVSLANIKGGYWGPRYTGDVIRINVSGGRGITKVDGAEERWGSGVGRGFGVSTTVGNEEGKSGKFGPNPFLRREIVVSSLGVQGGDEVVGEEIINTTGIYVKRFYNYMVIFGVFMSAVFIAYTSVGVLVYYVIPVEMVNKRVVGMYEGFVGVAPSGDTEGKFMIIYLWVLSFLLMALFLTGMYVEVVKLVYNFVESLFF